MRIRSKITGTISTERADIAKAMIRLGVAELVEEAPKPMKGPVWTVGVHRAQDRNFTELLLVTGNGLQQRFSGPPDVLRANSFCLPLPDSVKDEYARAWQAQPHLQDAFWKHTS